MIAYTEGTYPLPPTTARTEVKGWTLEQPAGAPAVDGGTLRLKRKPPRLEGSFDLPLADGTAVSCTFDLRQGDTAGERIRCASGFDGDD